MNADEWVSFWKKRGEESEGQDPQTRVYRTFNQKPIPATQWERTVAFVQEQFPVCSGDTVLDLCAGNGLFARIFADAGAQVTAVDVSPGLLADIDALGHPRIRTLCQDMRDFDAPPLTFSHIFLYAGIQYISHAEAVSVVRTLHRCLRDGGIAYIGDIPDAALRWAFYNTPERRALYFQNLREGRDVIGTWFEREWVEFLSTYTGFSAVTIIGQDIGSLNAHYRFDAVLKK